MNLTKLFYSFFLVIVLASCVKVNDKIEQAESTINIQEDSTEFIYTAEYVLFWNKFSKALVQNDSLNLSHLIDDNFYGICNTAFDFHDILKLDVTKDSIITKARFIKEFSQSLNPVFIDLLNHYEVHKDTIPIKTREAALNRYTCSKEVKSNYFSISIFLAREIRNEEVSIQFYYLDKEKDNERSLVKLIFRKTNEEIKLSEISFLYFLEYSEGHSLDVVDHTNEGDQTKWSPRVY